MTKKEKLSPKAAKKTAMEMAAFYRKKGMSQSEALKHAWEVLKKGGKHFSLERR